MANRGGPLARGLEIAVRLPPLFIMDGIAFAELYGASPLLVLPHIAR